MREHVEQTSEKPPTPKTRLERERQVVHIYKPEGKYTIIYGGHGIPVAPNLLPENLDGLFLETGTTIKHSNYGKDPLQSLEFFSGRTPGNQWRQYKKLFPPLEEKRIPVYFADLAFTKGVVIVYADIFVPVGESVIGATMLTKMAQEAKISRRNLLKLGVAVWLSTPFISNLARVISHATGVGEAAGAKFHKFSHKIHPEQNLLAVVLRDAIIAQKEEWLMKRRGNQPHMGTVLGAMHTEIEDQIQHSSEDRLAFLRAAKPIWKQVISPETFSKMVRFDFNGKEWQVGEIFEVPELKELISP